MKIKWDCPSCNTKDAQIEEIMVNTTIATTIKGILEGGELEYDEQTNSGGVIDRFQCVICGHVLRFDDDVKTAITEQNDLYFWLKRRSFLHVPDRRLEMLIALNNGAQWITEYVEVPGDTPEDELEEVGRQAVMKLEYDSEVAGALLYNSCPG